MAHHYNRFYKGRTFTALPRHKRADAVFQLKHRIARGKYRNFASYDVLSHGVSWADVYFIGRDRFTLWNATLETTACRKDEQYSSIAWQQTRGALTQEEYDTRPDPFSKKIKLPNGHCTFVRGVEPHFEKFEGRTFNEQMDHVIAGLTDPVYEHVEIDRSYAYGVGLHASIDVPLLTIPIIEAYIDDFNAIENPISFTKTTPAIHTDAVVYQSNAIDMESF